MWRDRVWWMVAGLIALVPIEAGAQCVGCAAGCIGITPGYLYCRAIATPAGAGCVAWATCNDLGGDGGLGEGLKRPLPRPSGAVGTPRLDAPSLEVYSLTFVADDAGPLFPYGARANVMRGVGTPFTPATLIAALDRDHPGVTSRLRLIEGAVLVGGAGFRGAFADDNGSGYALDLRGEGAFTRLAVCEVVNEQRSGHLATASAAAGDVLLVRLTLDGHDAVLALAPAGSAPGPRYGTSDPRSPHAEFVRQSGARTRPHRDVTIAMHLVETNPAECR